MRCVHIDLVVLFIGSAYLPVGHVVTHCIVDRELVRLSSDGSWRGSHIVVSISHSHVSFSLFHAYMSPTASVLTDVHGEVEVSHNLV